MSIKNYAKLSKEIMDFPSCILDKKFYQFIKAGYHEGFVCTVVEKLLKKTFVEIIPSPEQ